MKIKIGLLIISSAILSACTNNTLYNSSLTSSEPKYKISDEDTKKWIIEGNKREQCIFNKEYRNKDLSKLTKIEQALHNKWVMIDSLITVIGKNNIQLIYSDRESRRYIKQQYHKFNHSEVAKFDKKWCQDIRRDYQDELNKLKAELNKLKIEEQKRQEQLEKESAARQAYYATPQGQAALAQQQMLAQQQAMQQQMAEQQRRMREAEQWNQLNQQIQNMNQSIQQSNQQMMQMYNNRTKNVSCYNALGNVNCYSY